MMLLSRRPSESTKAHITIKGFVILFKLLVVSQSRIYNSLVLNAKISIFLEKWEFHIFNDIRKNQILHKVGPLILSIVSLSSMLISAKMGYLLRNKGFFLPIDRWSINNDLKMFYYQVL